jgi:hypothetical protein
MYGHLRSLGRSYQGQEMVIRFEAATRCWVVVNGAGEVVAHFLARELTQDRILRLAVGRKRSKGQMS